MKNIENAVKSRYPYDYYVVYDSSQDNLLKNTPSVRIIHQIINHYKIIYNLKNMMSDLEQK